MKGKLIKKEDEWSIHYLDGPDQTSMPLHPGEFKLKGLWKLKNKEVEFDIIREYVGFRTIGDPEKRNYVEIYQNYAKIKNR